MQQVYYCENELFSTSDEAWNAHPGADLWAYETDKPLVDIADLYHNGLESGLSKNEAMIQATGDPDPLYVFKTELFI